MLCYHRSSLFHPEETFPVNIPFLDIRFFHQSHNTVLFGGLFTLKRWIISSLKHDTLPRVNKLYCFYVKNPQNVLHYGIVKKVKVNCKKIKASILVQLQAPYYAIGLSKTLAIGFDNVIAEVEKKHPWYQYFNGHHYCFGSFVIPASIFVSSM